MSTAKSALFRVGDWVSLLYGPRRVLAQVVEDRGRLGVRRRRLYGIRLEFAEGESTTFEVAEDDLEAATEADRAAWKSKGSIALHQTVTYYRNGEDGSESPKSWHHYLVVARPGPGPQSGVASIIPLLQARVAGSAQGPSHTVVTPTGGPEAALAKAEAYLDAQHPGLRKTVGEKRP
jgi:hypothetical protein